MKTKYCSYSNAKDLPLGCKYCVTGEKTVIFITGICPRHCFFCPISEQKKDRDVIYANELPITKLEEIFPEADSHDSKGAGITGGDPLAKLPRTVECIKLLKARYGKQYHIHLYTSLNLATESNLRQLFDAGLDEIRFHIEYNDTKFWNNLKNARLFSWQIGVEVPIIPGTDAEMRKVVDFIHDKIDFLNMNELELAEINAAEYQRRNFRTKGASYAIEGSLEMGKSLLRYCDEKYPKLPVHVCTARLKDHIQLTNRLKRKTSHVKNELDEERDGVLIRGCVYPKEFSPKSRTGTQLKALQTPENVLKLRVVEAELQKQFKKYFVDEKKLRFIVSPKEIKKVKKLQLFDYAIVEEFPTADQTPISISFLE